MTSASKSRNSKQTLSEKLAVIAGSGTVAAMATGMPTVADADIVASSTTPIASPTVPSSNFWDVDADGTDDFELRFYTFTDQNHFYEFASLRAFLGGRLVSPAFANPNARGIAKLPAGVVVGTALASAYKFWPSPAIFTVAYGIDGTLYTGAPMENSGWALGDTGFFGFKFTNAADTETFYGWGELTIYDDATGFSINRAYYNNTAGGSIHVGVPEPSSGALFALGAAGLALYRRRRKAS